MFLIKSEKFKNTVSVHLKIVSKCCIRINIIAVIINEILN